jgi:ureidoglycolate hydrolase
MHSDVSVINDDLYEKLLKLAQHDNTNTNKKTIYKKKTTKKKQHKKSMRKKTKKRKY